jgi:hypothetical protein
MKYVIAAPRFRFVLALAAAPVAVVAATAHADDDHGPAKPPVMVAPKTAVAQPGILEKQADLAARVKALLQGYEAEPTRADWEKLPRKETMEVLIALSEGDKQPVFVRARALAVLGFFPTQRSTEYIKLIAAGVIKTDPVIRRAGMQTLTKVYPELALEALVPSLDDPDEKMREAAITELSGIKSVESLEALKVAQKKEVKPQLKALAAKGVTQLQAAGTLRKIAIERESEEEEEREVAEWHAKEKAAKAAKDAAAKQTAAQKQVAKPAPSTPNADKAKTLKNVGR